MKYTPRLPKENVNISKESPIREFFVLLSGILAIIIGLYFILGLAIDFLVPKISPELEKALGRSLINQFEISKKPGKKAAVIQDFADRLQKKCINNQYDFKLFIVKSDQINAIALPGGHIIVFSELLKKIESENELAFVLLHEMGHFANRDHLRGLGRTLVFITLASVLLGADSQVVELLTQGITLSESRFSRKQETAADEYALKNLNCFYGYVAGAGDFFNKLADTEKSPGFFSKFYLTHPETQKRVQHLENFAKTHEFPADGPLLPVPGNLNKFDNPNKYDNKEAK